MCHPGLSDGKDGDPIIEARQREYDYFNSDEFLAECTRQQVNLVK